MSFVSEIIRTLNIGSKTNLSLALDSVYLLDIIFSKENAESIITLYEKLDDSESKKLLLNLITERIKAAFNGTRQNTFFSDEEWKSFEKQAKTINCDTNSYLLDIIETFVLEGYNYNDICCVRRGDYVLDCGAYTGNTSLYFADKAGNAGKVFAFEAMPETFAKLQNTIARHNKTNIHACHFATSDKTGELYFSEVASPGSGKRSSGIKVPSISIDDFVEKNNIERVDFIKMDIEGSKLDALNGAEKTCQRFKPDLAVCVYHKATDLIEIPRMLMSFSPYYHLYLKHNSRWFYETVLFAKYNEQIMPTEVIVDADESMMLSSFWNTMSLMLKSYIYSKRKHLLHLYNTALLARCSYSISGIYEKETYLYCYYPISDDQRLHYEYIFNGNSLNICLHFEGKHASLKDVMTEICGQNSLTIQLQNCVTPIPGCSYSVANIDDYNYAASLMKYLIDISMPILIKHKLVSDRILLAL